MPQVQSPSRNHLGRLNRRVLGVIVIGAVICIVLILIFRPNPKPGLTAAQVGQQAQILDNAHNYTAEQALLENYITGHSSNPDQYPLLIQLGTLDIDNHNNAGALKWYKQAESVTGKIQITDAAGAAIADAALGNKTEAISYYKHAIALTSTSQPDNGIDNYKAAITALGGTP